MTQSSNRSIGEVLALLKPEFEDITISKIRFLEGQGLITPQRTASGYRKFSDGDIEKLKFILREQKEHFLPLKVIKGRLSEREEMAKNQTKPSDSGSALSPSVNPMMSGALLNRSEFLGASGLSESQIRELEGFGLILGQKTAHGMFYGEDALVVAKLAARFLMYGVEPRHLRIFKTGAEREADLYKQLAGPVLGSRNTQARMEALARLEELNNLGESLRSELLKQALENT